MITKLSHSLLFEQTIQERMLAAQSREGKKLHKHGFPIYLMHSPNLFGEIGKETAFVRYITFVTIAQSKLSNKRASCRGFSQRGRERAREKEWKAEEKKAK